MCHLPLFGSLSAAPLRRQTGSESAPSGPANLHSQHGNSKAFRDPKPEKPARWWRWARLSQKDTRELKALPQKPEARAQSYIAWNHMNIYSRLGPERAPGLLETIGHHYWHPCDCEYGCWSACNHRHQKRDSCLPWWEKQQKCHNPISHSWGWQKFTICVARLWENSTLTCGCSECQVQGGQGKGWQHDIRPSLWLSSLSLSQGPTPKNTAKILNDVCMRLLTIVLFIIAKAWKQPRYS